MQILVIWNNHEFGVLMNGSVKCVKNQGRNIKCIDGNLVHTPYDPNKDTYAIKSPWVDGVSTT